MELDVIVLAGGKGSRLKSDLPKPLHEVAGMPTIKRILTGALSISRNPILVVGDRATEIMGAAGKQCRYVLQKEQRGTGHAVRCVKESLLEDSINPDVMVLPGDHPLIDAQTLVELSESHLKSGAMVTLSTLIVPDFEKDNRIFFGYGRIQRDATGSLSAIVELKDATEKQKSIKEVNVGYYCFRTAWLWKNIDTLTDHNAAREFYLTDLLHVAITQGAKTNLYSIKDPARGMGFNTPEQLEIIRKLADHSSEAQR